MPMWDKLFGKKDEGPARLNPIVQKHPMPSAPPRASAARPAEPAPVRGETAHEKSDPHLPRAERETKSRKKGETGTKTRVPTDEEGYLKRGLHRQAHSDHDGAIEDFNKAIQLNGNLAKAYAARGVSREAKGDGDGAKSDYSKSIQIEIMNEIGRQMRENPDVEV